MTKIPKYKIKWILAFSTLLALSVFTFEASSDDNIRYREISRITPQQFVTYDEPTIRANVLLTYYPTYNTFDDRNILLQFGIRTVQLNYDSNASMYVSIIESGRYGMINREQLRYCLSLFPYPPRTECSVLINGNAPFIYEISGVNQTVVPVYHQLYQMKEFEIADIIESQSIAQQWIDNQDANLMMELINLVNITIP